MSAPSSRPSTERQASGAHGRSSSCSTTTATASSHVVLPTVTLPVLSPGYPLARDTAAMEAATARHFQPGQAPYGKRGRSADTTAAAVTATPPTVLDTLNAEERTHTGGTAAHAGPAAAIRSVSHTKAYLTRLFQDATRQEQDVFRLVDVVQCRRELRIAQEEEAKKDAEQSRRVRDFNSCLTAGQHRRYRTLVVEWLRHQPSRSAPPNSGEVLKVIQQEQQLFLAVLRREATTAAAVATSSGFISLYEWVPSTLKGFAKGWRTTRMRRQLLCFLDDAKAHTDVLLQCCSPAAVVADGANSGAADYSGVTFERDATMAQSSEPTPQQLHQRRYPSLRVLQMHMSRLYNALQTGLAAPFPNPQVRSAGCGSVAVVGSGGGEPQSSQSPTAPSACSAPSQLSLRALPTDDDDNARGSDEENACDNGEEGDVQGSNGAGRDDAAEADSATVSFVAHHVPLDAATPLSVPLLRSYVEQHLLRRFGWRPPPQQPQHSEGDSTNMVESISLSITFAALLKLFVAHVDTEEPRTSFRLPVRVELSPVASASGAMAQRYRAHVMVGDVVPNVRESRHSVQVAAAEHLLLQHYSASEQVTRGEDAEKARHVDNATGWAGVRPISAAQVHLSRAAALQSAEAQGASLSGTRIAASANNLISVNAAAVDVAPELSFHVVASDSATDARTPNGDVVLVKMERLNPTIAAEATATAAHNTPVSHLPTSETAVRCPFLLECLSPREMLQLDLLFACYPDAVVQLHRVQLTAGAGDAAGAEAAMQVLAVETLTVARWAHLRAQLQHRPAESLLAAPTPAEVLATQSWDLLYDTLAWLLDAVERHATDALRAALTPEAEALADATVDGDRLLYLILSNHANLVNTTAKAKWTPQSGRPGAHAANAAEVAAPSFTESRFAVRYVLQDVLDLYPDYEPRIDVAVEAAQLRFLEVEGGESDRDEDEGEKEKKEKDSGKVAARLYRDPHSWNADTIPFTFHRTAVTAEAASSAARHQS